MDNEYWRQARTTVLMAMAKADPAGLCDALARRSLVSWLRERVQSVDAEALGLPEKVIMVVQLDFKIIEESDAEALALYEACEVSPVSLQRQ